MPSEIIPFGKYKGQPIEVLQQDKQYLEWLKNQDWFVRNNAALNTIIINNFREPCETPEHNKLQAMFLDIAFCDKFMAFIYRNKFIFTDMKIESWEDNPDYKHDGKQFVFMANQPVEQSCKIPSLRDINIDVEQVIPKKIRKITLIPITYTYKNAFFEQDRADVLLVYNSNDNDGYGQIKIRIELKPVMSDDYPAVLRQCKNNNVDFLVIDRFSSSVVTLDQVKEIFSRSHIKLILTSEFNNNELLTM